MDRVELPVLFEQKDPDSKQIEEKVDHIENTFSNRMMS